MMFLFTIEGNTFLCIVRLGGHEGGIKNKFLDSIIYTITITASLYIQAKKFQLKLLTNSNFNTPFLLLESLL